jgi:hypothetical protein
MFLHNISILFFATIMLISTSAMPSQSVYQIDDGQMNNGIDNTEMQGMFRRPNESPFWLYKRNSALCDYRLQLRPLPLTSALCGYGLFDLFLLKYIDIFI